MKALIDTNIIIDILGKREPFYQDALHVFRLCELRRLEGVVSATSITDIAYILRKFAPPEAVMDSLKTLLAIMDIASVTKADILSAMELPMPDFEDAVQAACAKRIKADVIITRNIKDFRGSPVKAVMPGNITQH